MLNKTKTCDITGSLKQRLNKLMDSYILFFLFGSLDKHWTLTVCIWFPVYLGIWFEFWLFLMNKVFCHAWDCKGGFLATPCVHCCCCFGGFCIKRKRLHTRVALLSHPSMWSWWFVWIWLPGHVASTRVCALMHFLQVTIIPTVRQTKLLLFQEKWLLWP